MPSRKWLHKVQDIIDFIDKIENYTENVDLQKFKENSIIVDAVLRNLEIIGEASSQLPESIRKIYPEIPWKQMKGLRNILIHEYFGVNLETIWFTLKNQLPLLKIQLVDILKKGPDTLIDE